MIIQNRVEIWERQKQNKKSKWNNWIFFKKKKSKTKKNCVVFQLCLSFSCIRQQRHQHWGGGMWKLKWNWTKQMALLPWTPLFSHFQTHIKHIEWMNVYFDGPDSFIGIFIWLRFIVLALLVMVLVLLCLFFSAMFILLLVLVCFSGRISVWCVCGGWIFYATKCIQGNRIAATSKLQMYVW